MRQEIKDHQRFSLRKVKAYKKAGLASVFLGTSLLMANLGDVVHADSKDKGSNAVIENEGNTIPAGAAQDQTQIKTSNQASKMQAAQTVTSQKADDTKITATTQNTVSQSDQKVQASSAAKQARKVQAASAAKQANKVTSGVSDASNTQNAGQTSTSQADKANDLAKAEEDTSTLPTEQGSTNTLDLAQTGKANANVTNKEVKAGSVGVDTGNMPDSGVGVRHIFVSSAPVAPINWPSNTPREADSQYAANIIFNYKYGDNNTINISGGGQESAKDLGYSVVAGKAGYDYRPSQKFAINVGYHYKYDADTKSIYYSNFHVNQDADWNNLVNVIGKNNVQIYPAAGKIDPMISDQNVPVVGIVHNIYNQNQGNQGVITSVTSFNSPYPTAKQLSKIYIYQVIPNMGNDVTDMVGAVLAPSQSFSQVAQVVGSKANLYNEPRTTSVTYYLYERPYRTIYHFLDSTGKEVAEDGDDTPHYAANGSYTSTYNNSRLQSLGGANNYVLNDLQNGQKVANDSATIISTWDPSINKFKNTADNLAFSVAAQGGHEDAPDYSTDPEDNGSAYNNIYLTVTAKTSELKPDSKGDISGDTTGIPDDKKNDIKKTMYETINQKITANIPSGAPQDLSRHINLGRSVTYNYQTGTITAPDWSTVSGQLPAVTVPKVAGYVAAPAAINAVDITGNQVNADGQYTGGPITINYTPSDQAHYKIYTFVDDQKNSQEIPNGRIAIIGQVGKVINPADQGLKVPDKYTLANGNTIPTSITMTMADPMDASQAKPIVIHLIHATEPRTDTESFTRTIYETAPDSANKQVLKKQTIAFTSTVNVDQVTGTASPDNWQPQGTDTWAALNIGGITNYTTLIDGKEGSSVSAVKLDPKTAKDVEVNVTFAPIPAQSVITFTDRVNDGTQAKTGTIATKTLNGNKGDLQGLDFGWVPNGYVEDGKAPAKIELGQNYTVYIKDGIFTVDHTDPKKDGSLVLGVNGSTFPSGVDKDDLNKDAQRVISVKAPDVKTQTIIQTVPMYRDATVDLVNSKVNYTGWMTDKPNDEFSAIKVGNDKGDIPLVPGYAPDVTYNGKDLGNKGLPAEKPTDPTKSYDVNVTYNPIEGNRDLVFTDPTGKQVGKGTIEGTEGTDVPVKDSNGEIPGLPDGYVPADNAPTTVHIPKPGEDQTPVTISVAHGKATVDHNHPKNSSNVIPGTDIHYPKGVSQDDLNGTQERIINVTKLDGSKNSIDQKVPVYRDAAVDEVTGDVTYTDWSPVKPGDRFAAVSVPAVKDGYKTYEPAVTENGQDKVLPDDAYPAASINPKGDNKPVAIDVHYVVTKDDSPTAIEGGRNVVFTDPTGKQVGKGTVKGTEGTDVPVKDSNGKIPGLPDGYVPADNAPTTVHIPKPGEDQTPVTISVEHGKATVDHNYPKNSSDVIPGTDIHYPKGVSQDDLNGTQERIINVTKLDGSKNSIDQKVPVYRDAAVDEVTGDVTYTDWSPAKSGDKFDSVAIPAVKDGYKTYEPVVTENGQDKVLSNDTYPAASINPKGDNKPVEIDVHYVVTKDDSPIVIEGGRDVVFTDPTGEQVGKGTVKGTEGTDVPVKDSNGKIPGLPDGYVPADNAPTTVHIPKPGEDQTPVTISVEHGKATVDHNYPKNSSDVIPGTDIHYPKGVSQDDLNGTQERIINVTKLDGTTQTVDQKVPVYRDAAVDEVTGDVTYTDWSPAKSGDKFDSVAIPAVKDGYKTYEPVVTENGQDKVLSNDTYPAASINPKDDNKPVEIDVHYVVTKDDSPIVIEGGRDVVFTDPTGEQVGKGTVKGTEGTDVPVKDSNGKIPGLPDGYVPADNAPTTVHIPKPGEDQTPVTISVEHGQATVDHNHPKNSSDVIPGTDIHYPKGVSQDDLNGTQERIINVAKLDGTIQTVDQKVPVYRDAAIDEVTGDVTYTDWSPVKTGDKFGAVSVPEITQDGKHYQGCINIDGKVVTLSDGQYPAATVDPKGNNKPQTINIKYVLTSTNAPAPDKPTQDIITISHDYRDGQKDKNGDPYVIQKGEKLPGGSVVSDITVTANDLNRTITRTITITLPSGTTETMTQKTLAHRDVLFDGKTGKLLKATSWTSETDHFDAINLDPVKGYTAHVLDPNGNDLGTAIPKTKIDPNDAIGGNQALTVKYTKDQAKDTNDSYTGYTGNSNIGTPSVQTNVNADKTNNPTSVADIKHKPDMNKTNDDRLQEEIDALKHQFNKLSNKVDKLAARQIGEGNHTSGASMSETGYANRTGYGVNTGTGAGYAYDVDRGTGAGYTYDVDRGTGAGYAYDVDRGTGAGYAYDVDRGTGASYAYSVDSSANEVAPSGYINYGYSNSNQNGNDVVQAAIIDNAAKNGYGQELPQTGSENETGIIMAGIMSLAMAAATVIGATKKKKEE